MRFSSVSSSLLMARHDCCVPAGTNIEHERKMQVKPVEILLVDDNPGYARLMIETLCDEFRSDPFELTHVGCLSEALQHLGTGTVDLVLLDLGLPDSQGWDTFARTHEAKPDVPIIVLTGLNDQAVAVRTMRTGAKGFLIKGQVDGRWVAHAIRGALGNNSATPTSSSSRGVMSN
jgi:DNA-binding NarL/FixJ family response regulator